MQAGWIKQSFQCVILSGINHRSGGLNIAIFVMKEFVSGFRRVAGPGYGKKFFS
jgi:hypothetical protein